MNLNSMVFIVNIYNADTLSTSLSLNSYENHTKVLTLRIRLYPNYLPFIADGGMDL